MRKNINTKTIILAIALVLIMALAFILIQESVKKPTYNQNAVPFGQEVETKGDKIRKEIADREKEDWPARCNPDGQLSIVDKAGFKFQSELNYDPDMKFDANEMKVVGLIKNNSSDCYATNIRIEITLVNQDGDIMQREDYVFLPSITDYDDAVSRESLNKDLGIYDEEYKSIKTNFSDLTIQPDGIKEFSEVIKVYESLTVGMGDGLKAGIKPQIRIISSEWVSS